jgi:fibro-slime domain-containing protein
MVLIMSAWLPWLGLIFISQLASATHLAYGSIYWSRSVLSGQVFNPACGTLTTAVTNNCWYTMTYQFAYRASFYGTLPRVVGNTVNLGTAFRFHHQTTYSGGCGSDGGQVCPGSSGTNVNYASTIGQSGSVSVIVQSYYAAPDWFLGQKGPFQVQLFNGWTVMSYQMCCRLSSLASARFWNNNQDKNGYLNFMVNGSETFSLQTTGLAREFFAQYAPISYSVPVVHPNPGYSFRFTPMLTSGAPPVTSGLVTQYPTSFGVVAGCTSSSCPCIEPSCPSNPVRAGLIINDGVTNYNGQGVSYINGQLLWTPLGIGLYAFQVKIGAGFYTPAGCNWWCTTSSTPGCTTACTFTQVSWSVLDFIMEVSAPCLASATNCNHNPYFSTCVGCPQCNCTFTAQPVTFYTGVLKTFPVVAYDIDRWQPLSMQNSILPQGSTLSIVQAGNPLRMLFQWTPFLGQVSSVVCFKAVDNGLQSNGAAFAAGPATSLGNYCVSLIIGQAALIYLSGIIRDFRKTHPDFNRPNGDNGVINNFVSISLGSDNKPSFNLNKTATTTTTNPSNFAQWFNDVTNINQPIVYSLSLSNGSVADPRIFTYYSTVFWPIDGLLFGNEGDLHNNYFTYEIHTYMGYNGGEIYTYISSDDYWIFVNRLQPPNWNLNGIHLATTYILNMDTVSNTTWKLTIGNIYTLDMFYAHRGAWTGPLSHDPTLEIQLPKVVLCNALSSGILSINFFPDFSTSYGGGTGPANRLGLSGSAKLSGSSLQLTQVAFPSFAGSAWYAEQQAGVFKPVLLKVLQGFQSTFFFQYTGISGVGSPRGFAFVMQNSAPGALGTDGSGLGYNGIPLSVAVEFDSFQDTSLADPAYDHVSVHTLYSQPNSASETTASLGISTNNPPMTFRNGTSHKIVIQYQPAQESTSGVRLGWIYIYMNANLAPVAACQLSMANLQAAFAGAAYVGFTAGQGPASTALGDILIQSWQTTIVGVSAAFTGIIQPASQTVPAPITAGLAQANTYSVDGLIRPGVLIIQTRDSCNNLILVGNDPASFSVSITRAAGSSITVSSTITAVGDGTYIVTFNPTQSGAYFIDIRYQTIPIAGSPYSLSVSPNVATTANSYIMPSTFPYQPSTFTLASPSVANPSATNGLEVVTVSSAGVLISNVAYDTTIAADQTSLTNYLNGLANGIVVALACSGDCVPAGGLSASLITAVQRLGATRLNTLAVGGSYAFVGQIGASSSFRAENVQNARATDLTSVVFQPQTSTLTWFNVSALSGGAAFGQAIEATSGGFARISIARAFFVQAGSVGTFFIQSRDAYTNPQSNGIDSYTAAISPQITLTAGGYLNDTEYVAPSYYSQSFYTQTSGKYQLYVYLSGVSISNSPLDIYVIPAAASAAFSQATGAGLATATSGVLACFNLVLKDIYGNTLTNPNSVNPDAIALNLTSPLGGTIRFGVTAGTTMGWVSAAVPTNPCDIGSVCNYQVCYTPIVAGLYTLSVLVNGDLISQSPLQQVQVQPNQAFPANCVLTGPGIANNQPIISGVSSTLSLQTKDLNNNLLTSASSFPWIVSFVRNGADLTSTVYNPINQLSYVGGGLYSLTWTPTLSGIYNVTVQWNNPQIAASARLVGTPRQPFALTASPGDVSTPSTFALSNITYVAGTVQTLTITGRDRNGNFITSAVASQLVVSISIDPITGSQFIPTIISAPTVSAPTITFQFITRQAGSYIVDIKLSSSGSSISGSPASVTVNAGVANCSMFVVSGVGQFGGLNGISQTYTVQARDTFGNNAVSTSLVLNQTITGQSSSVVLGQSSGPGLYSITYLPPAGVFTLTLRLPTNVNNPASATPCTIFSRVVDFTGPTFSFARPETSTGYRASGYTFVAGTPSKLFIIDYNSSSYSKYVTISPHPIYIVAFSRSTDSQILSGVVTALPQPWNSSVDFTPTLAGQYFFNLTRISGFPVIANSPNRLGFNMSVVPGPVSQPNCIVSGLVGNNLVAGTNYSFDVQLKDGFQNTISAPGFNVIAQVDVSGPQYVGVYVSSTGLYRFTYTSTSVGLKNVVVSYQGLPLQQSSFAVTFVAGAISAPRSFATIIPASSVIAGSALSFTVTLRDTYDNPAADATSCSDSSTCAFAISINTVSPFTPTWSVSFAGSGVFSVLYTSYRTASPATLSIKVGTTEIGSLAVSPPPYQYTVTPAAYSPTLSNITNVPVQVQAGQNVVGFLSTFDIYGNPWLSAVGSIYSETTPCTSSACSSLSTPSYLNIASALGGGRYRIQFQGTNNIKASFYQISLAALGLRVTVNNPASLKFETINTQTYVPSTKTTLLPTITVYTTAIDTIFTFDQYDNPTLFNTQGDAITYSFYTLPATGALICSIQETIVASGEIVPGLSTISSPIYGGAGTGYWNISITPQILGYYYLNISINGEPIPCSTMAQLTFQVIAGAGDPSYSTVIGAASSPVVAGVKTTFLVSVNDRYGNPINRASSQPSPRLDVQFGLAISEFNGADSSLSSQFPIPGSLLQPSWLSNSTLGPHYSGSGSNSGYFGCIADSSNKCPAVVLLDVQDASICGQPLASFYCVTVQAVKAMNYSVVATYKGGYISGPGSTKILTVIPSVTSGFLQLLSAVSCRASAPCSFVLQATDAYGNTVVVDDHSYIITFISLEQSYNSYSFRLSSSSVAPFSPPTYIGGGRTLVEFTPELVGRYSVFVTLKLATADGLSSYLTPDPQNVNLIVDPQPCGATLSGGVSATPYQCPTTPIQCVSDYSQCPGIAPVCPSSTPVKCADGSCAATVCPCPNGQTRYEGTTNCVPSTQQRPTIPNCPVGTIECSLGVCRASTDDCPSVVVCTPGTSMCPDGISCAVSQAACPVIPPCGNSQVQCPNGQCVAAITDCPTAVTCPSGQVVCASDGSCQESASRCPPQYNCTGINSVRCTDGSCVSSASNCPSAVTCPVGYSLCPNGACVTSTNLCLPPVTCPLDQILCASGFCANATIRCPSAPVCPDSLPVLCSTGQCVSSVSLCDVPQTCVNSSTVSTGGAFRCPDGTCVSYNTIQTAASLCPSNPVCPAAQPVLCSYGACVASAADCNAANVIQCPSSLPFTCPNGACSINLANCPSQVICPATLPILCPDGSCQLATSSCPSPLQLACTGSTPLVCPDGSCVSNLGYCPTVVTCAPPSIRCADGSCRLNDATIPSSLCPSTVPTCGLGFISCPASSAGLNCAKNVTDCPQNVVCPVTNPVRCIDGTCASDITVCPPVPATYPAGVACPDGTWASSVALCASPVVCPAQYPVKCSDGSCRLALGDCLISTAGSCPADKPYQCPTGACVANMWDPSCSSTAVSVVCDPLSMYPISCAAAPLGASTCVNHVVCTGTETFPACCDGANYLTTNNNPNGNGCPANFAKCFDGTCVSQQSLCISRALACPDSLPFTCPSGLCSTNSSTCNDPATGCPTPRSQCWDGSCATSAAAALTDCPSETLIATACGPNRCLCPAGVASFGYGQCVDGVALASGVCSAGVCPSSTTPCASGLSRCLDGSCQSSAAYCSGSSGSYPYPNSCPADKPMQCPDGYCAQSLTLCGQLPLDVLPCPLATAPFRCASGTCVLNPLQCPVIRSCLPNEYRCGNGQCMAGVPCNQGTCDPCPVANTCPKTSSGQQLQRCDVSGLCVANKVVDCITDPTSACPDGQKQCANGICSTGSGLPSDSNCAINNGQSTNGCPIATPNRCAFSGACVLNATTECFNDLGCPNLQPILCSSGVCVDSPAKCASTSCAAPSVTCPSTGLCSSSLDLCTTTSGCPITSPVRCLDGSCRKYAANSGQTGSDVCPSGLSCSGGTTLCADGSCALKCPTSGKCPSTLPFQCASGKCEASAANCAPGCPAVVPVLCPNGLCVADASACPAPSVCDSGVRCSDGTCKSTYQDCINVVVRDNQPAEAACSGATTCSDGSCASSPLYCAPVRSCGQGLLRCSDGSCISSGVCPSIPSCASGTRCEDGLCRTVCLRYMGCSLANPYLCKNRECAGSFADETNGRCEALQKDSLIQGIVSGRRLLADPVKLTTYDVDPKQNLPIATDLLGQWGVLKDLDDAWKYAGEKFIYTAHSCGYGTSANTCGNCNSQGCVDLKTGGPCVPVVDSCNADGTASLLLISINSATTSEFSIGSYNGVSVGSLLVPAGAFGASAAQLTVRAVATSQLTGAANIIDLSRSTNGYVTYFTLAQTLLSTAFECVVDSNVNQPFQLPLTFTANVDLQRYPSFRDICLALVTTKISSNREFRRWTCVNPTGTDRNDDANSVTPRVSLSNQVPVGTASATITQCKAGSYYGFIHNPRFTAIPLPADSTTWIQNNLVYLILGLSLVLALLLLAVYGCVRLSRYRKKYHDSREAADAARENLEDKQNFGARAGRQDQEIMLTENPLVTQLTDLATNSSAEKMANTEQELVARQEEASQRQATIKDLASDKESLAAQLAALKSQLGETEGQTTSEPKSRRELHSGGALASGPASRGRMAPPTQTSDDFNGTAASFKAETIDQAPMSRLVVDRAAAKQRNL